jgi:glycogen debranching enzyme
MITLFPSQGYFCATACIGSISESFDAEEPFTPRGCVAQAWSVAEVLRCWVKTSPQAAQQPADPA